MKKKKQPEKPAGRKRHTCTKCKKKKEEQYMKQNGVASNNFPAWECLKCDDENRQYGQNKYRGYGRRYY